MYRYISWKCKLLTYFVSKCVLLNRTIMSVYQKPRHKILLKECKYSYVNICDNVCKLELLLTDEKIVYVQNLGFLLTLRKIAIWLSKNCQKLDTFFKKIAKNFHFFQKKLPFAKLCQVFGNFLTVKWQFYGGSEWDLL